MNQKVAVTMLRKLGYRGDEARYAAARCEAVPDASLEDGTRLALSLLMKPCHRTTHFHAPAG